MSAKPELPVAIEAEQAVLGGLMLRPEKFHDVADWLQPEDFYRREHGLIYRAIGDLLAKGTEPDAVTLGEWLEGQGIDGQVGGARYILELANGTPSAANLSAYADIVVEKARLRRVMDFAAALTKAANAKGAESTSVVAEAAVTLAQMQVSHQHTGPVALKGPVSAWLADLNTRFDAKSELIGFPTPWHDLNEATLGLRRGDLIFVGGRSNMGKSVLAFQLAQFFGNAGRRAVLFSLETTGVAYVQRQVACVGSVPFKSLMKPADLEEYHWPRITEATMKLRQSALLIDEQAGLSVGQIVARAKREHLRAPLSLVVIDHIHIIKRPGRDQNEELGQISKVLKALAKDLNVPVLVLAQLNRAVTKQTDKRPTMSDLRGCGDLEQDADMVLLIHREDYYAREPDKHPLHGVVEVIVGKGRDVQTGATVILRNRYDQMRLDDWEGEKPDLYPKTATDEAQQPETTQRGMPGTRTRGHR